MGHLRQRSSGLRVVAIVAGFTVLLAGCGGASDPGGGAARPTDTAFASCAEKPNTCNSAEPDKLRQAGQLTYAIEKNVANWNLLSGDGNAQETSWVLAGVLPRAFVTLPDLTVVLNEDLLDSVKVTSTDPHTIVYKIKSNAVWSDGTPITADDFIYNWRVQNARDCPACNPATTTGYDQIKSVVGAEGGKTVTVTMSKPFADWRQNWGSGSPIYPAHIAAQHGDINTPAGRAESFAWFGQNVPAYTGGPYQIENFANNESITLVPNPKWYGPRPKLDRLIYRIITDAGRQASALGSREVQVIYPQPQVDQVQQVRRIPGVSSFVGFGLSWEHFDLNLGNPFLTDAVLRTAIFTAVDRQAIINKTVGQFTDKIKPLNNHNFVPQQSGYEDVVSESGQGSGNVAKAQQILRAGGYKFADGELKTPIGMRVPPLRIRYTAGNQVRQAECELFAQQMKPLGITIQVLPTENLAATLTQGDYDVVVFAWPATPFSYSNAVRLWVTGQGGNPGRYSNANVDRLITTAASATDEVLARELLNQAGRRLTRDAYVLPLYQRPTFLGLYDDVANVRNNSSLDGPQYNIAQWGIRGAG